ncbi:MAG: hypothetical protein QXS91_02605 [Candidatus Anstonellales archaeon]
MANEKLTFSKLRDILREEMQSGNAIIKLDENFYKNALEFLTELEKKAKQQPDLYYNDYSSARATFERLLDERIRKILVLAYSEQADLGNLTEIEKALCKKVISNINEFKEQVYMLKEKKEQVNIDGKKKIKIKKYVPLYINQETKKSYGPFEEGSTVLIEEEEAEILIKTGYAEPSE